MRTEMCALAAGSVPQFSVQYRQGQASASTRRAGSVVDKDDFIAA